MYTNFVYNNNDKTTEVEFPARDFECVYIFYRLSFQNDHICLIADLWCGVYSTHIYIYI